MVKVETTYKFYDLEAKKQRVVGEVFEVSPERKDVLLSREFVKVIEVEDTSKEKRNVEKAVKGKKKAIKSDLE